MPCICWFIYAAAGFFKYLSPKLWLTGYIQASQGFALESSHPLALRRVAAAELASTAAAAKAIDPHWFAKASTPALEQETGPTAIKSTPVPAFTDRNPSAPNSSNTSAKSPLLIRALRRTFSGRLTDSPRRQFPFSIELASDKLSFIEPDALMMRGIWGHPSLSLDACMSCNILSWPHHGRQYAWSASAANKTAR